VPLDSDPQQVLDAAARAFPDGLGAITIAEAPARWPRALLRAGATTGRAKDSSASPLAWAAARVAMADPASELRAVSTGVWAAAADPIAVS
jgi:hypothetical protein